MNRKTFGLTVTATNALCPTGEKAAAQNAAAGAIPVLSCEGPCIRGEIARLAAHRLAREPGYRRACHGELVTVPDSAMAQWVKQAKSVVVIDGCHLKCHARLVAHLVPRDRLCGFDAAGHHQRYSDLFDHDAVPEKERTAVAAEVAQWVGQRLRQPPGAHSNGHTPASTGSRPKSAGQCRGDK